MIKETLSNQILKFKDIQERHSSLCRSLNKLQAQGSTQRKGLYRHHDHQVFAELTQKENAKVAIQEILQEIFNIFSKNLTQSAWDGISIVRFFTSKIGLYQQIQRLEACLRTQMEKELTNPESEDLQHTSQRVKKYFQGIDAFLKENQYSLCAWEIIRAEIHRCFVLIDKLTRRLSN
uniref:Interferon epsilon n=1 Tax=Gopherus evgoodei TaxID=1825980 RepID=A0A8C4YS04_9SAUR